MSGTLEGKGPNAVGVTTAPARDLGFNSMHENAATAPGGKANASTAPLVDAVIRTNDTQMEPFPTEGTLESGGANG